jgi:hypothetical protein
MKKDVYEIITNHILETIQQDAGLWEMPWYQASVSPVTLKPKNLSGYQYSFPVVRFHEKRVLHWILGNLQTMGSQGGIRAEGRKSLSGRSL